MKTILFLSLFFVGLTANARNVNDLVDDLNEFSMTAAESSITITNKRTGKVTKFRGEGCSSFAEIIEDNKLLVVATSDRKYARLRVKNLKYNKLIDEYKLEQKVGNDIDKVKYLIGGGSHVIMTATYENQNEREEISCIFNHRTKIRRN